MATFARSPVRASAWGVLLGLAFGAASDAQQARTPPWKVHLETAGGWTHPKGIVVDSSGQAVTLEARGDLSMPRCSQLSATTLTRAAANVTWLSENLMKGETQWSGHCMDDLQVDLHLRIGDRYFRLRYPLGPTCRNADDEPPAALRDLVDDLLKIRSESSTLCK